MLNLKTSTTSKIVSKRTLKIPIKASFYPTSRIQIKEAIALQAITEPADDVFFITMPAVNAWDIIRSYYLC